MFPIKINPFPGDIALFQVLNNFHSTIFDRIMLFTSTIGEWAIIWALIAFIIFLCDKKRGRGILFMTILAIIISSILNDAILKTIFFRERPYLLIENVHQLGIRWINSSFVSGHTASSFAAAFVLIAYYKKFWYFFIFLAVLIAYSRIYLGMHYPSDIIGGIIIGALSAFIVFKISKKR